MDIKLLYSSTLLVLLTSISGVAQDRQADSVRLRMESAAFSSATDLEGKMRIFQQVAGNSDFKKISIFRTLTSNMARDLAIEWAAQADLKRFYDWYAKIEVPYTKRVAKIQGFTEMSTVMEEKQFRSALGQELDVLKNVEKLDNEQVLLYQGLLELYLGFRSDDLAKTISYIEPLYNASGEYFPTDASRKRDTTDIGTTLSYQYADALFRVGASDKAKEVLARAILSGAFTIGEIKVKKNSSFQFDDFSKYYQHYADSASANYAELVRGLLKKNTLGGTPYDIKDFEGQYILLDFWGSWCLPCRFSHPKLKQLYDEYKSKGLEIISVAHEAPASAEIVRAKWTKAVKEDKMDWIQILNNEGVEEFDAVRQFMINSFPTKILLDKNLNKIAIFTGGGSTDQLIEKLKELMPTEQESAKADPPARLPMRILSDSISKAASIQEKLSIYDSKESVKLRAESPLAAIALSYPIALYYIGAKDKKNSKIWLDKVAAMPMIHGSLLGTFYKTFQESNEHQYIVDSFSAEMDSLHAEISASESIKAQTFNTYGERLPNYIKSKLALKDYEDVIRHLGMVFGRYKSFLHAENFYQYAEALVETGKSEEAIPMFAVHYTNRTDFSPSVEDTRKWLESIVSDGAPKFQKEVEKNEARQKDNFAALIGTLKELKGVDLPQKLGESKYILLSFWGTWCIPCIQTHPKLVELYSTYKDQGLEILGIASENGSDIEKMQANLINSIEKQELPWLQSMLTGHKKYAHPVHRYRVNAYPTKILVDRNGVIVAEFKGNSAANEQMLKQILAENLAE